MASLRRIGKIYYAQYYIGKRQKRICLQTSSLQIAREKIRQIESAQFFKTNPLFASPDCHPLQCIFLSSTLKGIQVKCG